MTPAYFPHAEYHTLRGGALAARLPTLAEYALRGETAAPSRDPAWLHVLRDGLGHVPIAIEATEQGRTVGYVGLCYVRSTLFGRFLVSLPYLNTGGVIADRPDVAAGLIDRAVMLARELNCRHLELRHESPVEHPAFNARRDDKVHMRLKLPDFAGPLWTGLNAKVRNQVRKGEKSGLTVRWGGRELLDAFYGVFAANMRDLGTPVFPRRLFAAMLARLDAEICLAESGETPVAAAILVHGGGVTEVPSASCLREYNHLSANMMMYWNLIDRAIGRQSSVFDFGRSTVGGNTYKFKQQWGAKPEPAVWQYAHRDPAAVANLRPDNPSYGRFVTLWKRLPLRVTNFVGPKIVRGIP